MQNQDHTLSQSVQPLSGPTAAWKTYHNEEYGFEIKYLNEWTPENNVDSYNTVRLFHFHTRLGYKAVFGIERFLP